MESPIYHTPPVCNALKALCINKLKNTKLLHIGHLNKIIDYTITFLFFYVLVFVTCSSIYITFLLVADSSQQSSLSLFWCHLESLTAVKKCSLYFAVPVASCQHLVILSTVKITFNLIIHLCVVSCSHFIVSQIFLLGLQTSKSRKTRIEYISCNYPPCVSQEVDLAAQQ